MDALSEVTWNGLDTDAGRVDVCLSRGEFGLSEITVTDSRRWPMRTALRR
jgi:hypothetical protein